MDDTALPDWIVIEIGRLQLEVAMLRRQLTMAATMLSTPPLEPDPLEPDPTPTTTEERPDTNG